MSEKRMLILEAEVVKRIDENRGDMNRSDFINFLIDSQFKESPGKENYATKAELHHLETSLKEVLRSFLDFFISYGLELGKTPTAKDSDDLREKLQALGNIFKSDTSS